MNKASHQANSVVRGVKRLARLLLVVGLLVLAGSCSTTKNIPDDDQLFVGLKKIQYGETENEDNFSETKEEVDAALATAPNGSLFGSSYIRSPFPYGLWIWNAFSDKTDGFSKWVVDAFGKKPVLMSWVNPSLRASVAQSLLRNHGYFHGKVDYEVVPQKNPKKSKISYNVTFGPLLMIDTLEYVNFPAEADSLIEESKSEAAVGSGMPFNVGKLDAERTRLSNLFRDNGYYYYKKNYTSFLADTLAEPGKAQVRLQLADDVPVEAMHKWYIGKVTVDLKRHMMEQRTDSMGRHFFKVGYSGKKPPVRMGVVFEGLKLRHGQPFSLSQYSESLSRLSSKGVFSIVDFNFTPRDTTALCDTLDMNLTCVLDKPYDFYVETDVHNKTVGRVGPELIVGLTKRNAFRGGEKFDISLHGSYEWETKKGSSKLNSYEYGYDVSLEYPRVIIPFRSLMRQINKQDTTRVRRRPFRLFYSTPSTLFKLSNSVVNRPGYFNMNTIGFEWTYKWQPTATSRHEFSPFILQYQHFNKKTEDFEGILMVNPYLLVTMQDIFIPKMRYSYSYVSPKNYLNPISWTATFSEAGNLVSLGMMAAGKKWNTQEKKLVKSEYAQFVKVETQFTKKWQLTTYSQFLCHLEAGIMCSYGNTEYEPYVEAFSVGGANSIRAFSYRSIGPGSCYLPDFSDYKYAICVGNMKFQTNLEYRARMFGNLHGALFIDAGNVWTYDYDDFMEGSQFKLKNFANQLAVGTGFGLRYDLDFLVLRLDVGIGLHLPYDTGKSGYFNIPSFKDGYNIHFAVGFPF